MPQQSDGTVDLLTIASLEQALDLAGLEIDRVDEALDERHKLGMA